MTQILFHVASGVAILIPLAIAMVAGIIAITRYFRPRGRGNKRVGWEAALALIGLSAAAMGGQLASDFHLRKDEVTALAEMITDRLGTPPVRVAAAGPTASPVRTLASAITAHHESDGNVSRVARYICTPQPLPGSGLADDAVISDRFRSIAFALTYQIGYPEACDADADMALAAWRRQMLRYLAQLLTSDEWSSPELAGMRRSFAVYYVPGVRQAEAWEIVGPSRTTGGEIFHDGSWSGDQVRPKASTLFLVESSAAMTGISADLVRQQEAAVRYLRSQSRLPLSKQDPVTVFLGSDPERGLLPVPPAEALEKVELRLFDQSGMSIERVKELVHIRDSIQHRN